MSFIIIMVGTLGISGAGAPSGAAGFWSGSIVVLRCDLPSILITHSSPNALQDGFFWRSGVSLYPVHRQNCSAHEIKDLRSA